MVDRFDERVAARVTYEGGVEMQMRAPEYYGARGPVLGWTLAHETVHAFLGEDFVTRAPTWLVEGAAEYFSREPGHGAPPYDWRTDADLNRAVVELRPGAYEAARARVAGIVAECGEYAVAEWLMDIRKDSRAKLGKRIPCDPGKIAPWQMIADRGDIQRGSLDEVERLLTLYRESPGEYDEPVGVELLPLDASVGLTASSGAFVLERTIRATRLPRQDAIDVLVAGLLPNRSDNSDRHRRFSLLALVYARTSNRSAADLLGHALSYGHALPPNGAPIIDSLQKLPRGVRAYWMGEALLRRGMHAEAEPYFALTVKEGPANSDRAHFLYAVTACRNGHYDVCLNEMDRVQMEPRYIAAPPGINYEHESTRDWWRAKAFAKLGRVEEARASFKESIVRFDLLNPYLPEPFGPIDDDLKVVICETGVSFAMEKKWKEANALFERADCSLQRGRAWAKQEMWVDAFLAFDGAFTAEEAYEEAHALSKYGLRGRALKVIDDAYGRVPSAEGDGARLVNLKVDILNAPVEKSAFAQRLLDERAANPEGDIDSDDLSDAVEASLGTDPRQADSDGDGIGDRLDPQPLAPKESTATPEDEAVLAALGETLFGGRPADYPRTVEEFPALSSVAMLVVSSNQPLFRSWRLPYRMIVLGEADAEAFSARHPREDVAVIDVIADRATSRFLVLYDVRGKRGRTLVWRDVDGKWVSYKLREETRRPR